MKELKVANSGKILVAALMTGVFCATPAFAEDEVLNPTITNIKEKSTAIINDTTREPFELSLIEETTVVPDNAVILSYEGQKYFYQVDDAAKRIDLQNLADTGSVALSETPSGEAFYKLGAKSLYYNPANLPSSAYQLTNDATKDHYNFAKYDISETGEITPIYYNINALQAKENKAFSISKATGDEDTTFTIKGYKNTDGIVTADDDKYSVNIDINALSTDKITWSTTGAETNKITIKLPNATKTTNIFYTYNKPSDYTETNTRITTITVDNVNKRVFKGISGSSNGGAINNTTKKSTINIISDFISNSASTSGGAIYNKGNATIGNITGDFISNSSADKGGAIYNYASGTDSSSSIGNITGDFISNSATGSGGGIFNQALTNGTVKIGDITGDFISNISGNNGGAILNHSQGGGNSTIGNITGDFISNSASTSGGAIFNYVSGADSATISNITGDFISNSAGNYGGAIYNYATGTGSSAIGNITGDFISNSVSTSGGAIYNYSKDSGNSSIGNITGDFISNTSGNNCGAILNYATGTGSSASIGNITGDFISNSASAAGGAIFNYVTGADSSASIGSITGDFISNSATGSGGGIFNQALTNGTVKIGDITGNFISNSATGSGGGISNQASTNGTVKIGNITGDFISNSASTSGGAIYNYASGTDSSSSIRNITGDFISNSAKNGGAIYNYSKDSSNTTIGNITGDFISNSASTSGGAIYNYADGTDATASLTILAGGDKDVKFDGNYVTSSSGNGGAIRNSGSGATVNLVAEDGRKIEFTGIAPTELPAGVTAYKVDTIYNNGNININGYTPESTFVNTTGTVSLREVSGSGAGIMNIYGGTVIANANISGQNAVNLYGGTLQLGDSSATPQNDEPIAAPTVSNLNYYDGTVSLINDLASDNFAVAKIDTDKTMNLAIDVDFQNIIDEVNNISASDMVKVNGTNKNIQITSLNVLTDFDGTNSGKIKISDGSAGDVHSAAVTIYQDTYKYVLSESTGNIIDVNRGFSHGLYEAIKDTTSPTVTYNVDAQENIVDDLGDLVPTTLNIAGDGNYGIDGNNHSGITVGAGKTLNITNVGSSNDDGTVKASINGFNSTGNGGFVENQGGIVDIENSVFHNNSATNNGGVIYNNGTLTITNSTFNDNTAVNNGGAIYNGAGATLNLNDNNTFENNIAGSDTNDIHNLGTLNINGNTVFDGGVTGTGTMNLKENISVDFSKGKLEQGKVIVSNGSFLNLDNENDEDLQEFLITDGGTAEIAIDATDEINASTEVAGTINIKSIDLKTISPDGRNVITETLADNIFMLPETELLNTPENINFISFNKTGTVATFITQEATLNNAITASNGNISAEYEMKGNEKVDVGSVIKGNTGSDFIVAGGGNSVTDGSIIVDSGVTYTNTDTSYQNNVTAGNEEAKAAITVKPNATMNLIAQDHDVEILNTDNNVAINLSGNETGSSTVNLIAADGRSITIKEDIMSDNKSNVINFNGGNIELDGLLDPLTANVNSGTIERKGYDDDITYNLNGGTLKYDNDKYLFDAAKHNGIYHLNAMNFNGGALDLRNFAANTIILDNLAVNSSSNIFVDVDLANERMDNFGKTPATVAGDAKLHVAGMNILSDAYKPEVNINFTKDAKLKKAVDYTGGKKVAYSPLYKYDVSYNSKTGDFNFQKDPYEWNPAITTSEIAAQMAFLNQVNSYEEAFANMDMMMLMPRYERIAMKTRNKTAQVLEGNTFVAYDRNILPEEHKGLWFKPYTSIERVALNNGPAVGNTAYGALVGGDSGIVGLNNGWDAIYSIYGGYNGSHQHHEGNSIYQNGGLIGGTALFYKGNFFTGLTANVGASQAESSTTIGNEDFTMLTTGVANKTGYNFEFFNGKFIVQPSLVTSYSLINTFNHRNSIGYDISADPLHAIQVTPGLKLIGNLPKGWQPYLIFQGVWNILDKTKFKANDVALPEMSINPYFQYGVGIRKQFGEKLTGSLQALVRSGGRNGIAFNANFRYALGAQPEKMGASKGVQKSAERNIDLSLSALRLR